MYAARHKPAITSGAYIPYDVSSNGPSTRKPLPIIDAKGVVIARQVVDP
jgi:hypothetical protein